MLLLDNNNVASSNIWLVAEWWRRWTHGFEMIGFNPALTLYHCPIWRWNFLQRFGMAFVTFAFFSSKFSPPSIPPFSRTFPPGFKHFPIAQFWWKLLYRFILGYHLWRLHIFPEIIPPSLNFCIIIFFLIHKFLICVWFNFPLFLQVITLKVESKTWTKNLWWDMTKMSWAKM